MACAIGTEPKLKEPNLDLAIEEGKRFDEDNALVEGTVRKLFAQFPQNVEPTQVLAKVVVLNQLYSARVLNIHVQSLAIHIAQSRIDSMLDTGSSEAVECIVNCPGTKRYYSFATKYCSWHRDIMYPIWDLYVDEALWFYKAQFAFFTFQRQDLLSYAKFREIAEQFRHRFGLDSLNFKQVDKFLWRAGEYLWKTKALSAI